jgi:hypothetical protein
MKWTPLFSWSCENSFTRPSLSLSGPRLSRLAHANQALVLDETSALGGVKRFNSLCPVGRSPRIKRTWATRRLDSPRVSLIVGFGAFTDSKAPRLYRGPSLDPKRIMPFFDVIVNPNVAP